MRFLVTAEYQRTGYIWRWLVVAKDAKAATMTVLDSGYFLGLEMPRLFDFRTTKAAMAAPRLREDYDGL